MGILIAMGGIIESEWRLHTLKGHEGYMTKIAITGVIGSVLLAIFLYFLFASTFIWRVRFDSRGVIFTIGKSLKTKIPWKDVRFVRCYEREGGFSMGKTIRGLELKGRNPSTSVIPIFSKYRDVLRMESDVWGQESLDKTVNVIRVYNQKYDFKAKIDEWETTDKFMFESDSKN
jgi:hypothetical protein